MRVSLKLHHQEEEEGEEKPPQQLSLLLRTKLPISIFNLPFLSSLSLSSLSPSSPTLSLQTHSSNGPSFKLSYTPSSSSPLTLSLSSGVSLSASPIHSPLTISAHFSLYPFNHSPSPTFSFLIKPSFGDFSIKKSIFSSPKSLHSHRGSDLNGFEPIEPLGSLKDSNLGPTREKPGVSVWARSVLPVTKRVTVRFRWGVNFPSDIRKGLPFLSLDKVGVERVEEREREERETDFEALRGMCASVGREVDDLRRENREMRRCFDEMIRKENSGYKSGYSYSDGVSKRVAKPLMVSEGLGEIEGWNKVKKKGVCKEVKSDLNGVNKEMKSNTNGANELESEFQRAIMAASASQ